MARPRETDPTVLGALPRAQNHHLHHAALAAPSHGPNSAPVWDPPPSPKSALRSIGSRQTASSTTRRGASPSCPACQPAKLTATTGSLLTEIPKPPSGPNGQPGHRAHHAGPRLAYHNSARVIVSPLLAKQRPASCGPRLCDIAHARSRQPAAPRRRRYCRGAADGRGPPRGGDDRQRAVACSGVSNGAAVLAEHSAGLAGGSWRPAACPRLVRWRPANLGRHAGRAASAS